MAYQKRSSSALIVLITVAFFAGIFYFLFGKSTPTSETAPPAVAESVNEPIQLESPKEEVAKVEPSSSTTEIQETPPATTAALTVVPTLTRAKKTNNASPKRSSRFYSQDPQNSSRVTPAYVEPTPQDPDMREPTQEEQPLLAQSPVETPPALPSESSVLVWLGAGASYLTFDQTAMGGDDQGKFSQLTAPAYAAGARVAFTKEHRIAVEFNSWSGQATTEAATQVGSDKYKWRNFAADYQYNFWKNDESRLFVLAGFNIYQLPFLVFNNDDTQTLARSDLKNLSLGILWERPSSNEITYEASLKYNHLIGSGSGGTHSFDADSGLQFQSTIGISKNLGENLRVGLFWQGHYQDIDYTSTSAASNGTLKLFNNSALIRLGYSF